MEEKEINRKVTAIIKRFLFNFPYDTHRNLEFVRDYIMNEMTFYSRYQRYDCISFYAIKFPIFNFCDGYVAYLNNRFLENDFKIIDITLSPIDNQYLQCLILFETL